MMVMRKPETSRNILPYFVESDLWKYECLTKFDNVTYWMEQDPPRACQMMSARLMNKKGFKVRDMLFDMLDCVCDSQLKEKTKERIIREIRMVMEYHKLNGTFEDDL